QRLIRRRGIIPLMYQHGDTVIVKRERMVRACSQADPLAQKNRIAAARGKYVYAKKPISYIAALWPRRLKLRTFHAGGILAVFASCRQKTRLSPRACTCPIGSRSEEGRQELIRDDEATKNE